MVRHNNVLPNVHLNKDWQEKVKTWFDQPGRKRRRRLNRLRKAKALAPNPTHLLRPAVRGQTNRYNGKIKLGRGFTAKELKAAGLSTTYARSIGIAVDLRRKDTCNETLKLNENRLREYLRKLILYPRKHASGYKYDKKPIVAEATQEQLNHPDAKFQNTTKHVIPLPKPEAGYSWTNITKEMKDSSAYKTIRTEWKTASGFYKRLEAQKKKAQEAKTGKK